MRAHWINLRCAVAELFMYLALGMLPDDSDEQFYYAKALNEYIKSISVIRRFSKEAKTFPRRHHDDFLPPAGSR